GRLLALDMFAVADNGPYEAGGDHAQAAHIASLAYQPVAMRFRGVGVMTNTPPRGAQRAPGGAQAIGIMEPVLAKDARKIGIDRVAIHRVNAPEGKALVGRPDPKGQRAYVTSAFV